MSKAYCQKANSKLKWEIEWCHPLQRRYGLKVLLNCMMASKNTRMQGLNTSELIRCYTAFWRLLKISCESAFACPKYIAERDHTFFASLSVLLWAVWLCRHYRERDSFAIALLSNHALKPEGTNFNKWHTEVKLSHFPIWFIQCALRCHCTVLYFLLRRHFHKKCPFLGSDHFLKTKHTKDRRGYSLPSWIST